jgi:hypothetical protein
MKRLLVGALWLLGTAPAFAQTAQDLPIDARWRNAILEQVGQRYDSLYVFADRGKQIRARLKSREGRANYDECGTASCLARKLTADLQSWSGDQHLRLVFSVTPRPMPNPSTAANVTTSRELEIMQERNYGFHHVERLHGNIGLIEIGRFDPAAHAADVAAAAMRFIANTDALIIDLRNNGGGHADMVAHLMSYFVREQTHLSTLRRRQPQGDAQVWTAASVAGPRYLDRPIYVLTGNRTFSAAEGMTYDLRVFAGAQAIGERTRGGANPGSFQQFDDHFAVFVPTGEMVNAKTKANWEGVGINPDVEVPAKQAKSVAQRAALQELLTMRPAHPRAGMWRQALTELSESKGTGH